MLKRAPGHTLPLLSPPSLPIHPVLQGVINPDDASYLSAEECVLAAAGRCTKAVCLGPSLARDSKATKAHEAKRDYSNEIIVMTG